MSETRSVELPGDAELAYSGAWTGSLRGQTIFREVELSGAGDEVLAEVGQMEWLTVLRLRGDFTDAGIERLRGLSGLVELELDSPAITCETALPAAPLRAVTLKGELITDTAVRGLGRYPELNVLRLASATATGAGLSRLPLGIRLVYLRLPRLGLDALAALERLPGLSTLIFAGTEPTPELTRRLAAFPETLARVEFLGVDAPDPGVLRPLTEVGIRVNAAEPM